MRGVRFGRLAAHMAYQYALASVPAAARAMRHKPVKATFEIVTVCNLRCLHCDIWKWRRRPDALTLSEWLSALRQLRELAGPVALGFSSGEPLLEPNLFPLLREANRLGILTHLVTNATLLTPDAARRLCEAGLGALYFSLDGLRPETHDRGRGVPGTYARVLAAIRLLARMPGRPLLRLSTIVAGHNLGELPGLLDLADAEGLNGVSFQALSQVGSDWEPLWPKVPAAAQAAIERLIALKRQGRRVLNPETQLRAMQRHFADPAAQHPGELCSTYTSLNIFNNGAVHLCEYKKPVGNLRERSLAEIWRGTPARERCSEILACKEPCILLNCHFRPSLAERGSELLRRVLAR